MDIDISTPEGLADLRARVLAEALSMGFDLTTAKGQAAFRKAVERERDDPDANAFETFTPKLRAPSQP